MQPYRNIGAMRTCMRLPPHLIGRARRSERLGECVLLAPAAHVVQFHLEPGECGDGGLPVRLQPRHQSLPGFRDGLAESSEVCVPNADGGCLGLEGGIPLLEYARVPHPRVHEMRFHVEHCPIEPAPPSVSTLLDQAVDPRLDDLHSEELRKLRKGVRWTPCNACGRSYARDLDAQAH